MPTIFTHAIFSSALGAAYATRPMPVRFWVWLPASALILLAKLYRRVSGKQ